MNWHVYIILCSDGSLYTGSPPISTGDSNSMRAGVRYHKGQTYKFQRGCGSRNSDLNNGIALTKNAHWLFDNGLWSIRDDYTVLVADRHFSEAGESAHLLAHMKNRKISLPANPTHLLAPHP